MTRIWYSAAHVSRWKCLNLSELDTHNMMVFCTIWESSPFPILAKWISWHIGTFIPMQISALCNKTNKKWTRLVPLWNVIAFNWTCESFSSAEMIVDRMHNWHSNGILNVPRWVRKGKRWSKMIHIVLDGCCKSFQTKFFPVLCTHHIKGFLLHDINSLTCGPSQSSQGDERHFFHYNWHQWHPMPADLWQVLEIFCS